MNTQFGFILKVLIASTVLSFLIKYGFSWLPLAPNAIAAIIIVCLPSLIVGLVLIWRLKIQKPQV